MKGSGQMLRVKMLMCLLTPMVLLNCYNVSTVTPFHALATEVVKENVVEMVHKDEMKLADDNFILQYNTNTQNELHKKLDIELEKIFNTDFDKDLQKDLETNLDIYSSSNLNELSNKKSDNDEVKNETEPKQKEFILTFYTSLECENSSAGAVTCQNKPLKHGGVANNVIPLNTRIYLEGYGEVTVNDRGSQKYFGVDNRLDVFIEREPGESDRQYSRRVNNYGVQRVQGYIIK